MTQIGCMLCACSSAWRSDRKEGTAVGGQPGAAPLMTMSWLPAATQHRISTLRLHVSKNDVRSHSCTACKP